MPVLVHAAERPLPRRIALRLLAEGGQVRATAADDVATLRAAGIHTARCDADDEGVLESALTQVHTLVLVLDAVAVADPAAVRAMGIAAARAADGAGISRAVLVTLPGSDPDAPDPVRRAHGEVAAAFADLPLPSVELRAGLTRDDETIGLLAATGLDATVRATPVASVDPTDLIELVVAVDAARSRASAGHLVLAASDPEDVALEQLIGRTADGAGPGATLVGRRLPTAAQRDLVRAVVDGRWRDLDPTVQDGWALLGVTRGTR